MDDRRFDDLTKSIAESGSRRDILKRIGKGVGLGLGIFGPLGAVLWSRGSDAALCREAGRTCRENADCCSALCGPKDATGRRECTCPPRTTPCGGNCCTAGQVCVQGTCQANTPTPT